MGFAELPEELDGADLGELMVKTAKLYQQRLKANDAVDFDDLINYVVKLFEESPETLTHYQDRYRYLMVDEYQDTNLAQFRLISALAQRDRNLCVVGDEDQSIYSWRGAELSNLLEFQKQYSEAKLIKLEQNYRSTGHVLAAASSVIHNNTERIGKTLWTESGDGLPIARFTAGSDLDEADGIALLIERIVRNTQYSYNDIAVFYRVKSLSRTYEEGMRRYDLPYQVVGGTGFYDRAEIRDLTAYLRLTVNPHQNMSLIRVINTPRRGVGNKTLDNLLQSANKKGVSLFQEILAALDEGTLKGKAKQALANLALQMQAWQTAAANESPEHLLRQILADTQYEAHLGDPSHLDVRGRLDNIEQLASALQAYHMDNPAGGLAGWLEQVALQSDQDDIDASKDKVSLMTLHAAKGLEFPVVFIVGLEEPLFPNRRATEERGNEEEERRLFYVGITRAERLLVLTHAERRVTHGDLRFNDPSTFLYEVPEDLITRIERLDIRDIDDLTTGRRGSPESLLEAQIERERHDRDMKGAGRGQQNRVANIMNRYGNADALPSYETMVPDDSADQREAEAEHGYDDATIQEMNRGGQQAEVWDATPSKYISGSGRRRKVMPKLRGGNKRESGAGKNFLPWVQLGKRVSHAMLGEGIVIGLSGAGAEKKILIQFDDGDEREMLAEYADLSPCD
jgi:DNA helicase-2/ATP-dependent DNA helicase PcrA